MMEETELPINGVLDLHAFHPRDIPDVMDAYIEACLEKEIRELRIIHGKGIGTQRDRVRQILSEEGRVKSFQPAETWGATLVKLY